MTKKYKGELEVDSERGVIYFHLSNPKDAERAKTVTLLRICHINKHIPNYATIDIALGGISVSDDMS